MSDQTSFKAMRIRRKVVPFDFEKFRVPISSEFLFMRFIWGRATLLLSTYPKSFAVF